ncbi:fluoride efflux transporter FluC [Bacillus pinisoli]|uniref:fluoride efflux transporter FluC n=1 Tax=Bacillus pinisoli TaxID=2901866 RepID=UPI001FF22303|nr:CrcB family protein [Bacillus pinisoli]
MTILYVCCGGVIGALGRYGLTIILSKSLHKNGPLIATFIINVLGSFILGSLLSFFSEMNYSSLKVGITAGIIGAFTTFSTYSLDCVKLLKEKKWLQFFIYSFTTICLCVVFFLIGTITF